jgi:hypothetical protein
MLTFCVAILFSGAAFSFTVNGQLDAIRGQFRLLISYSYAPENNVTVTIPQ